MERYCIYLRKSRADMELEANGEMETLARHEKSLLELARKLKLPVTEIKKEIVSGETIAARPVVQQLLDEVEQGIWTGVLVIEIERLARGDTIDQGIIARAFKIHNTKIVTPVKTYDPSNEFDEEYFEFGLFMSRREYKTINRRIQRGRVASAKEGKFLSSVAPYGYNKVKITGDKGYTLKPNEEAATVKMIYDLYLSGVGMTVIANHLDALQIKPRYRDNWSKSTISDILKNPVYIGKIRWSYRKEQKKEKDGVLTYKRITNTECIYVDGLHPAIILEETFDQAQELMKHNRRLPVKKDLKLKNPFTGLMYCQKCGATMTRLGENSRNKYDTMKCSNKNCDNVSAPVFMVEEKLLFILRSWLDEYNPEYENNMRKKEQNREVKISALNSTRLKLNKLDTQISNTYDLLEQGVYTVDVFTQRLKLLTEQKDALIKNIEALQVEIDELVNQVVISIPLLKKIP